MTNIGHTDQLVHLPVPENDAPVWLTSQGDDLVSILVIWRESRRDKFLRTVHGEVVQILGERLLVFAVGHLKDRKLSFVTLGSPLAHAQVLAILGQ